MRNAKTPVRVVSLIVLVLMLLVIAPSVLAYTYYATFSMSNNSTTSYTSLPVQRDVNNLLLVTQGFMSSSGLDSRVETAGGIAVPHMVADNRTFAVADSSARSNNNLYYTTGSTPLSSFYIIPGYGGYFSVADTVPELATRKAANLEAKMEEVNAKKKLVRRTPTEKMVEKWIAQAKKMPKVVSH